MTQHKSIHLISCLISVNMQKIDEIIHVSSGFNYSQSTSRNITIFRCKDYILNHNKEVEAERTSVQFTIKLRIEQQRMHIILFWIVHSHNETSGKLAAIL